MVSLRRDMARRSGGGRASLVQARPAPDLARESGGADCQSSGGAAHRGLRFFRGQAFVVSLL